MITITRMTELFRNVRKRARGIDRPKMRPKLVELLVELPPTEDTDDETIVKPSGLAAETAVLKELVAVAESVFLPPFKVIWRPIEPAVID